MNNIKASLGYGFEIKPEDYIVNNDMLNYRLWLKKLYNTKYFYSLNDFVGDSEFFGIIIRTAPFGELSQVNEELTDYINYNEVPYFVEEYQKFFPHCKDRKPVFYIMCEEE